MKYVLGEHIDKFHANEVDGGILLNLSKTDQRIEIAQIASQKGHLQTRCCNTTPTTNNIQLWHGRQMLSIVP
jgi:hypothetical protein